MRLLLPALLACLLALPVPVLAQGNQGGGTDQTGRGTGPAQGGRQPTQPSAQTAQVGAGTTDSITTGVSGPESVSGGPTTLPPLPEPKLCDAYRGSEAYRWCLSVVLRDGSGAQAQGDAR